MLKSHIFPLFFGLSSQYMEDIPSSITITPQTISMTNADDAKYQDSKGKLECTLPISTNHPRRPLYLYQGFWCPPNMLHNIIAFQTHFQAHDTDIILATKPKSGTTWLKSLTYSILNRNCVTIPNHPLLTKNPHELAPFIEFNTYKDLSSMIPPRLFSTHIPYNSLPTSVKESKCRIVCMARNPCDTFVSLWKFATGIVPDFLQQTTMEDFWEGFCRGEEAFGPYWDHVLGYWKESLERPNKVLFIKYEDMKENGTLEMKKLAEFLGCEFSLEEERQGVIQEIIDLCSLSNLKELEVNKTGKVAEKIEHKAFFRKGEVGDWVNYLNPTMVEKLKQVLKEKLAGSGLEFKM